MMRGASGFTLIEMMLVVIIIGILASMVVPSFVGRAREARIKAAEGDISNLGTALELFELEQGAFPSSLGELLTSDKKYLRQTQVPVDPWGNAYTYSNMGDSYTLSSAGPDGVAGTGDDITSANLF